jgi:hypothetical protein
MQQPPPPPPTPTSVGQPERHGLPKGLKLLFVLVGVFVIMTGAIAYANRWFISYLTSTSPHAISYQVTGNGMARVTYLTPAGRQTDTVSLPWEVTLTVPDGSALSIAAAGNNSGLLTCRVKWEGHTIGIDAESSDEPTCTKSATA